VLIAEDRDERGGEERPDEHAEAEGAAQQRQRPAR
jgi:hypothetical protein